MSTSIKHTIALNMTDSQYAQGAVYYTQGEPNSGDIPVIEFYANSGAEAQVSYLQCLLDNEFKFRVERLLLPGVDLSLEEIDRVGPILDAMSESVRLQTGKKLVLPPFSSRVSDAADWRRMLACVPDSCCLGQHRTVVEHRISRAVDEAQKFAKAYRRAEEFLDNCYPWVNKNGYLVYAAYRAGLEDGGEESGT